MVTPAFSDCVNKLGVDENDVIPFGRNKAKISLDVLDKPAAPGKLILVKKPAWRFGSPPWARYSAARAAPPAAVKAP